MKKSFLMTTVLSATITLSAENRIANSSFESGDTGFSTVRYQLQEKESGKAFLPVWTKGAAPHGEHFLKFPDSNGGRVEFMSPEITLTEKERIYTVSAWIKSEKPTTVYLGFFQVTHRPPKFPNRWFSPKRKFKVGPEWKRYSATFEIPPEHQYGFVTVSWKEGSISLDGIQFESGKGSAYAPQIPVEIQMVKSPSLSSFGKKEIRLRGFNDLPQGVTAKGNINVDGKEIPFTLPLEAKKSTEFVIQVDLKRYGVQKITGSYVAGSCSGTMLPWITAVMHPLPERSFDPAKEFGIGVSAPIPTRPSEGQVFYRGMEKSRKEFMEYVRALGVRILRLHDAKCFDWPQMEPDKGKFDWTAIDSLIDAVNSANLVILPVLGNGGFRFKAPTPSDWFGHRRENWKQLWRGSQICLPKLEDWREYCHAFFEHCKGKIQYYECMNEPNLILTPEEYVPYLKIAYEEAKKVDPSIKIVGICATGDLEGRLGEFIEKCGELGAFQYCDVISFHPYSAQLDNFAVPAEEQIAEIRKILKKYGYEGPLWNTELYYIHSGTHWRKITALNGGRAPHWIDAGRTLPHNAVRRSMIDLGSHLDQSISMTKNQFVGAFDHPHFGYDTFWGEGRLVPNEMAVAFNAFAYFLEGAKSIRPLKKLFNGINGYLYLDRNGEKVFVLWTMEDGETFHAELPDGAEAYDLFGNRLKGKKILLTEVPVYFKKAAPETLKITPNRICTLCGARWIAETRIGIEIQNNASEAQTFRLRLKGGRNTKAVTIAGGQRMIVPFEMKSDPGKNAVVFLQADGKITKNVLPLTTKKILKSGSTVQLPDGSSFTVTAEQEALRFEISVKDDQRGVSNRKAPWDSDCIEIFIDSKPTERLDFPNYTEHCYRLFLCPAGSDGKAAFLNASKNLQKERISWKIQEHGADYTANVMIPWSIIHLNKPAEIAFDIVVNDSDGTKRKRQTIWAGNQFNWRDRFNFGILLMKKEGKNE